MKLTVHLNRQLIWILDVTWKYKASWVCSSQRLSVLARRLRHKGAAQTALGTNQKQVAPSCQNAACLFNYRLPSRSSWFLVQLPFAWSWRQQQKKPRVFSELASVAPLLPRPCSSLSGDGVDFPTQSLMHSRGVSPSFWLCSTVITTCLMSLFTYMRDKAKWNFNGLCGELTTTLWHVQQRR